MTRYMKGVKWPFRKVYVNLKTYNLMMILHLHLFTTVNVNLLSVYFAQLPKHSEKKGLRTPTFSYSRYMYGCINILPWWRAALMFNYNTNILKHIYLWHLINQVSRVWSRATLLYRESMNTYKCFNKLSGSGNWFRIT